MVKRTSFNSVIASSFIGQLQKASKHVCEGEGDDRPRLKSVREEILRRAARIEGFHAGRGEYSTRNSVQLVIAALQSL